MKSKKLFLLFFVTYCSEQLGYSMKIYKDSIWIIKVNYIWIAPHGPRLFSETSKRQNNILEVKRQLGPILLVLETSAVLLVLDGRNVMFEDMVLLRRSFLWMSMIIQKLIILGKDKDPCDQRDNETI